ncbi:MULTISPECIES: hypothetical protein [unclassified Streptomyces]|uniref:hypothetical protein n=1 Tax=unclassified Streptomyces TaxID=2593676 RepID=UPI000A7B0249|nr:MULTISPECIES: hypothetical protein [unclassified Streptomyces]AZM60147.1 hypothetical protein DLM49_11795 [Streptomyces sp. WAC 01438]RSM96433.1 hypothetical protein DMA10_13935 [Streptomyces sp. WAC 01420]
MTSHPGDGDDERDGADDARASQAEPLVCAHCGTRVEGPQPTWTFSVENGTPRHYCERCSRENLRAIEGRLDARWW